MLDVGLCERCDGPRFRQALADALAWLEGQVAEINALNVFPVPDGDTGTNMSLTLQAAVREVAGRPDSSMAGVTSALARGALLGARGNSGVILSQFFRGIARALDKHEDCGGAELAHALATGSSTAYKGVLKPVEGTMLTVSRDIAQAAREMADSGGGFIEVLDAAVEAARSSVARTPTLLPVLRQAGVVDAGGQGLLCILEGLARSLREESFERLPLDGHGPAPVLDHTIEYGYCTEFLIRGDALDLTSIQAKIVSLGDSALVVGDDDVVRIHVHTFRPGLVLEYATSLGTVHQIKIDNMQDQHQGMLAGQIAGPDGTGTQLSQEKRIALIAVLAGDGFADLYRSLGASGVIPGGQTMNPSTSDMLEAIEDVSSQQVILLPNNPNIILAAQQAKLLATKEVGVIPTRNMAQGIAAALAFQAETDLEPNIRAMERAIDGIRTAEITTAVRSAKINGLEIDVGQIVGFVEGNLVAVGDSDKAVLDRVLTSMVAGDAEILTVYCGSEVDADRVKEMEESIRLRCMDLEVEFVYGGQPLYQFLISVE